MNYYPICLDITGRPCIVIGGGRVAARKVQGLLAHNARVTVISPELNAELASLRDSGRLAWRDRPYREGD
ncbi:MAG: bifunctional precorrin-2 dehydrogenase/sirohydrochlorin ferrochelatase, partial [Desulfobulbaceae bacterium]|nr:bifunctional precorrin-2 dehydrogenase/sirohydrochlorin ferrochelatase [Desulfobulbaceae bacterium]